MNGYKTLFEKQSYIDSLTYYNDVLNGSNKAVFWDYVILTASNERQAEGYREQINYRRKHSFLPKNTKFAVLADLDGKRVGSGGATFNVIKYINEQEGHLDGIRILVIHSGGDSKRVPQYSACGKLFSPVPRILPNGKRSTLFDEFLIGMSTVASRISEGMLVCSGDVLLLYNALQVDFFGSGAAALSIKEDVQTGKNHGVYLKDENGNVGQFLHKQSVEILSKLGALDEKNRVDIDTGAVILSSDILNDLYELIDTKESFDEFVNEQARISFYADFLYPLATDSTLEQFYNEKPEGDFTPQLKKCREAIWNVLHKYSLKLIRLSPASFIHFGTTRELLSLMTTEMEDYRFLGWNSNINCNISSPEFAVSNSYISRKAIVKSGSYVEDCYIHKDSYIGSGSVLSGVTLNGETIPENVVLHGLKLDTGKFVARLYGVNDNPKENKLFGKEINEPLWDAKIYPVCDTIEKAVKASINTIINGEGFNGERISLKDSFNFADVSAILPWQEKLNDKIKSEVVLQAIEDGTFVDDIDVEITERTKKYLLKEAEKLDVLDLNQFSKKIRIYYYLYKLTNNQEFADKCFMTICNATLSSAIDGAKYHPDYKISKDELTVNLPVRVNWGGGWSDTPPYCMEHGGTVLNAAISFDGKLPIEVTLKKTDNMSITLASTDIGSYKEFTDIKELQDCRNPSDAFALHKAALIACGVIPANDDISVEQICTRVGGGFYMNTRVINIPKGSGLGTSSILSGACVKALYEFFGKNVAENDLYNRVLCMEQLMSTGGGWQDQVGGLAKGIKMVTSKQSLNQQLVCTPANISKETLDELSERFALIYTGQRRLARNLLREVVGKYIGNNPDALEVIYEIQRTAVLMRFELEKGNVDGFAGLLNKHWELSKRLDSGCTNTCINQIFTTIEDLIDGRMICGAGGGGFLQVILKKGVSRNMLKERLHEVFADSGVDVWGCKFE